MRKVAIGVVEFLRERFSISDADVRDGLKTARHPGRLESHGRFLFDGAHNIGGAKALRSFLDEFVHEPITMVFGSMNDKDVSDVTTILFPKANMLILTRSENSRAMSADELTALCT
jgi:dihydrofolate synthase/folylpolyglutamate synthase